MAVQNTPQGLPYPTEDHLVRQIPESVENLALALDKRIVGSYANASALAAAGTFAEGSLVWLQDSNTLQVFDGSTWRSVYPATPRIYSGTSAPASNLGSPGDFYIEY